MLDGNAEGIALGLSDWNMVGFSLGAFVGLEEGMPEKVGDTEPKLVGLGVDGIAEGNAD